MFNIFFEHIKNDFDFLKKSKLLVCVSGGLDSMVLIDLLCKTKHDVSVAHCNFKLREKESDLDEEFVKEYCLNNSIPFFSKTFVTQLPKNSLQMAARKLRYDWFYDLSKKKKLDYILTAHHMDDSLETFILNLSRATGLEGLMGIKSMNGIIIRPLLIFSKNKILKYAKKNNIKWREDSSNIKNDYLRNQIRNQIIPFLKQLHPKFLSQSNTTMSFLKNSNIIIEKYINIQKKDNFYINGDKTIIAKKFIKDNKVEVYQLFKDYNFKKPDEIIKLCNSISGKIIESDSHILLSDRSNLILKKKSQEFDEIIKVGKKGIDNPIKINIEIGEFEVKFNHKSIFISKDEVKFPLILRKFRKGDIIYPLGMKGKKLISKYYKDQKMSFFDKQNQWLLCNQDEVNWIVGERVDRRYFKSKKASIKIDVL